MSSLTKGQQEFMTKFERFLASNQISFMLTGMPGTGKTYALTEAIKQYCDDMQVILCAPTNKAALNILTVAKEFSEDNVQVMTLHKALSQIMSDEDVILTTKDSGIGAPIMNCDLIVVDEASMVDPSMYQILMDYLNRLDTKLLIVCDKDQLKPPKSSKSPLVELVKDPAHIVELTENNRMAEDSELFKLVKNIRSNIRQQPIDVLNNVAHNKDSNVFLLEKTLFEKLIFNVFNHTSIQDKGIRILTWKRETFAYYNQLIREQLYGEKAINNRYLVGERVISYTTSRRKKKKPLRNDPTGSIYIGDEGHIINIKPVDAHPNIEEVFGVRIPALNLTIRSSFNGEQKVIQNIFVSPNSVADKMILDVQSQLEFDAKNEPNKKQQKYKASRYHQFRSMWFEIEPVFAQTVHSSQGSTYDTIFFPLFDLTNCYDMDTYWRLLYVAASRPKFKLIIGYNKQIDFK